MAAKKLIIASVLLIISSCASSTREAMIKSSAIQREFSVDFDYKTTFKTLETNISNCHGGSMIFAVRPETFVESKLDEIKKIGTIDMMMNHMGRKFLASVEVESKNQTLSIVRIYAPYSTWDRIADRIKEWAKGEKAECW